MLLRADVIHSKAQAVVRRCGTRDALAVAEALGVYVHRLENLRDLLGMYTYRQRERHILLNARMEPGLMQLVCAHELGHEHGGGTQVHVVGRTVLLNMARAKHENLFRQRHGFHLVVSDVDAGGGKALMQPAQFYAHLVAEIGVEVGERFVEEEHAGFAHDGAAHGHSLALAAGKLAGHAASSARRLRSSAGMPRTFRP